MIFPPKEIHFFVLLQTRSTSGNVSNGWSNVFSLKMVEILLNLAEWLLLTWFWWWLWSTGSESALTTRWPDEINRCHHMWSAAVSDHSVNYVGNPWQYLITQMWSAAGVNWSFPPSSDQIWSANITLCDQSAVHVPAVNRVKRSVTSPWPLRELPCK